MASAPGPRPRPAASSWLNRPVAKLQVEAAVVVAKTDAS